MANKITTVLDLDGKGWKSGLSEIKKSINDAEGATNKLKAGWAGAFAQFKSSAGAQAAVGAAIGAVTVKAISDASALEESINAVNVAYGDAAEGVHALGENSALAFGMSQRAFNEFSVQFSAFANDIAASSGRSVVSVVEEMTTRVADFASVNNLDMSRAAEIFQSSLAGETEALRRFGGDVSAAAVEQFALTNGLVESKSEMTEAIKVQARYGLLMEETAKTAGDFANTQDSLANQQRILSAQVEDISASFGSALIPVVTDAARTVNNLITVYDQLMDRGKQAGNKGGFDGVFGALTRGNIIGQTIQGFEDLAKVTDYLVKATENSNDAVADGIDGMARARAQQDAYVESIIARAEGEEVNTEAMEAGQRQQDAYVQSLISAGQAVIDKAAADAEAAEAAERHAANVEMVAEAMEAQHSAAIELIGGDIAVRQAQLDAADAAEELNTAIEEQGALSRETEDALLSAKDAQLQAAQAATDYRLQQMEANGESVNAAVQAQVMKEELQRLADKLDGPLRQALLDYIAQLNAIPTQITTNVNTHFNSRGDNPNGPRVGAHAKGTDFFEGGLTWVGEQGKELVDLPRGTKIYPHGESMAMLSSAMLSSAMPASVPMGASGGGSVHVTVNMPIGSDGRSVVREIKRFERFNGAGWRS